MDLTFRKTTFAEAFAEARKLKLDEFVWNGKRYHTKRADEQ